MVQLCCLTGTGFLLKMKNKYIQYMLEQCLNCDWLWFDARDMMDMAGQVTVTWCRDHEMTQYRLSVMIFLPSLESKG